MNPVVHFEMQALDRKQMANFYTKVFGWKTRQMDSDTGNYVVVTTVESDEKGMPKKPGSINGGFYEKTKDMPAQPPSFVIGVENINEHMKKVEKAGGRIQGKVTDIPGVGKYVSFIDTEGNRVSLLQPSM